MTESKSPTDDDLRELGLVTWGATLAANALRWPLEVALTFAAANGTEQQLTWTDLDYLATRLARGLAARGVKRGRTVAAVVPNSPELVAVGFATWRAGGCFLPVNTQTPLPEGEAVLELVDPAVVVVADDANRFGAKTVTVSHLLNEDERATPPLPDTFSWPGKAIASGGSTGRPKIIVTPKPWAWMEGAENNPVWQRLGMRGRMRHLVSGPLYHNWQFDLCFTGLVAGCPVVLMERFDAARAVGLIRRHQIEYAGLVPTTMRRIAQLPDLDADDFASLEAICHTAAPCPPALKRQWMDLLGPERVYEIYGAAEQFGICVLRGDEWLAHPGSVGLPVESEVQILDEDGRPLPAGTVGTIFLRRLDPDEHTVYAGAPAAPSTADGFYSVGDLGWLDEEGFLYLADRRTDLIISGGVNVYPAEVEAALAEHPAVADSVVIGLPDDEWGKRVHAVVELREGASVSEEDLRKHCLLLLSKPKVPKSVEFVERLPRSDAGKLQRTQLAAERGA